MVVLQSSLKLAMALLVMAMTLLGSIQVSEAAVHIPASFNRSSFPKDFVFGAASASYQYEGAANEGGKGPSNWDTFTHKHPEKIVDQSTGDVAIDFYHRYKSLARSLVGYNQPSMITHMKDIHMIKDVGLDAFRLSISWSRILPTGKIRGGVNQEGIKFYKSLFSELTSKGIKPFVTLFHWDIPQALEDEYDGFLNSKIVKDFEDYANICFKEFGDRVKHWITLNEPQAYASLGYDHGIYAPGRCSSYVGNCSKGNSATEPYVVAHNLLLSHSAAVKLYKHKYQRFQKGEIGITLNSNWFKPKSRSAADLRASLVALDFKMGWFLHPITYGDYPSSMRRNIGSRLPEFSKKESKMIKGSMDFLGVNYYTSSYASPSLSNNSVNLSASTDSHVDITSEKNGVPICQATGLFWIFICPSGIRDLMLYLKEKYKHPTIYITENGMAETDNGTVPVQEVLRDTLRIKYYREHLWYLQEAIREGANVKGHFAWSFFDNFEWAFGYTVRFGINYVDYKDGLRRYPKDSAIWYKKFLEKSNHLDEALQISATTARAT